MPLQTSSEPSEPVDDLIWVTHEHPVGRSRQNYIANVDLGRYDLDGQGEQLWLRPVDHTTYEVACIPFSVYGLAYRDRVHLTADGAHIRAVVEPSGHRVFRILLMPDLGNRLPTLQQSIRDLIGDLGLLSEWQGTRHVAIDVPPGTTIQAIVDLIEPDRISERLYAEWGHVLPFDPSASK